MSKNKWKSKMLSEIGTNSTNANATHFFNKSIAPIITSKNPTTGKTYPVAPSEFINFPAAVLVSGKSIGMKCNIIFAPKTTSANPKIILTILVNIEFISVDFELVIR